MSETCFNCTYNVANRCVSVRGCCFIPHESINISVKSEETQEITEKEYLDKLVNDHWAYIESVLYRAIPTQYSTPEDDSRIEEIEFHYKSSAKHFWSHAREYHVGSTL